MLNAMDVTTRRPFATVNVTLDSVKLVADSLQKHLCVVFLREVALGELGN
jgi:inorganic triphosphatase YgiF